MKPLNTSNVLAKVTPKQQSAILKLVDRGVDHSSVAELLGITPKDVAIAANLERRAKEVKEKKLERRRYIYDKTYKTIGVFANRKAGIEPGNRVPVADIVGKEIQKSPKRSLTQIMCGDPLPHQQRWRTS